MGKHLNVVVLSFVVFAAVTVKNSDTLEVKVYYETRSLKCVEFITKQLHTTYMAVNTRKHIRSFMESEYETYMTVKLVPYGNAFKLKQLDNGTWQIACREWGDTTCAYNKYHACAVEVGVTPWKSLNFIAALVESDYRSPGSCALRTCFDDVRMPACVNTVDGDQLLIGHGLDTIALNLSLPAELPVVTFDGRYEEGEQGRARENLLALVCEKTGGVPAVCSMPRASRAMTHHNFGTGQFYPKRIDCEY